MTKNKNFFREASAVGHSFIGTLPCPTRKLSSVTLLALGGKGERESDCNIEASITCCSAFGVHRMTSSLVYWPSCWMTGELEEE